MFHVSLTVWKVSQSLNFLCAIYTLDLRYSNNFQWEVTTINEGVWVIIGQTGRSVVKISNNFFLEAMQTKIAGCRKKTFFSGLSSNVKRTSIFKFVWWFSKIIVEFAQDSFMKKNPQFQFQVNFRWFRLIESQEQTAKDISSKKKSCSSSCTYGAIFKCLSRALKYSSIISALGKFIVHFIANINLYLSKSESRTAKNATKERHYAFSAHAKSMKSRERISSTILLPRHWNFSCSRPYILSVWQSREWIVARDWWRRSFRSRCRQRCRCFVELQFALLASLYRSRSRTN